MKIKLIVVGKTDVSYVKEGLQEYEKRISKYISFEIVEIADVKQSSSQPVIQRKVEAEKILNRLKPEDFLVLLDEHGKEMTSVEFADFLNQKMNASVRSLVFLIGGAYGFDDSIRQKSTFSLALSKMTFPHQLVRLIFIEQLYRALSILKNEPYHH